MTEIEHRFLAVAVRDLPRIASALERIAAVVERASADDEREQRERRRA